MARKRVKKQTLAEFRAWLSGVEELQPEDWAPNAAQWKTIREKMDHISEPKNYGDTDMLQKLIEAMGNGGGTVNNSVPQPAQGNPYAAAHIPAPPPVTGGIPDGPVEVAPAAAAYVAPPAAAPAIDIEEVAKPKDTGDGNYNSGFI